MRALGCFIALVCAGCASLPRLEPLAKPQVVSARVAVTVEGNLWDGEPANLAEVVTPVLIHVENGSDRAVRLNYASFVMVGQSGFRYRAIPPRYRPALKRPAPPPNGQLQSPAPPAPPGQPPPPGQAAPPPPAGQPSSPAQPSAPGQPFDEDPPQNDDSVAPENAPPPAPPPPPPPTTELSDGRPPILLASAPRHFSGVRPMYGGGGRYYGGFYGGGRGYYRGYPGGAYPFYGYGAFGFWPGYFGPGYGPYGYYPPYIYGYGYNPWAFEYYEEESLPTQDMIQRALPEGVLKPGGKIAGFLYFPTVARESQVMFEARISDAQTQEPLAQISIPFQVVR